MLQGQQATTHWAFAELLPMVGATHEKARVVKDGNVIAARRGHVRDRLRPQRGGQAHGEAVAQAIQMGLEYDPAPPRRRPVVRIARPSAQSRPRLPHLWS